MSESWHKSGGKNILRHGRGKKIFCCFQITEIRTAKSCSTVSLSGGVGRVLPENRTRRVCYTRSPNKTTIPKTARLSNTNIPVQISLQDAETAQFVPEFQGPPPPSKERRRFFQNRSPSASCAGQQGTLTTRTNLNTHHVSFPPAPAAVDAARCFCCCCFCLATAAAPHHRYPVLLCFCVSWPRGSIL